MNKYWSLVLLMLLAARLDAAAFTSVTTGDWDDGATWGNTSPGVEGTDYPGDGDTATIDTGDTVTVSANQTVGDAPNPAANVITCNTTGAITVAAGVTLTIKGCFQGEDGNFTLGAGSVVEFQVGSGLRYWVRTGKALADTCVIVINGTSGSRAAFRSASGGGVAYIDSQGFAGNSRLDAEYCDFTLIGDATEDFAEPYCNLSGRDCSFVECVFDQCGELDTAVAINADSHFLIQGCKWTNTVSSSCATLDASNAPTGGVTRSVIDTSFDKTMSFASVIGWTIQNVYFGGGFGATAGTSGWTLFEDNLIYKTDQPQQTVYGNTTDCFFYKGSVANPHFCGITTARGLTISGCIFEHGGTQEDGDCVVSASAASAYNYYISDCIVLPNSNGGVSGTLFTAGGNANVTWTINHNTYIGKLGSTASIAETYTGHAGLLASFQSNLCWHPTSATAVILDDSGTDDAVNDYVTDLGYNGVWNGAGTLYALDVANDVANDLTANDVSGDPDFEDETRDLGSWGQSNEGTDGSASAALAVIAADPTKTANLVTWVKAGFVPHNVAFDGTAHDAGDIGAMDYEASGSAVPAIVTNLNESDPIVRVVE